MKKTLTAFICALLLVLPTCCCWAETSSSPAKTEQHDCCKSSHTLSIGLKKDHCCDCASNIGKVKSVEKPETVSLNKKFNTDLSYTIVNIYSFPANHFWTSVVQATDSSPPISLQTLYCSYLL